MLLCDAEIKKRPDHVPCAARAYQSVYRPIPSQSQPREEIQKMAAEAAEERISRILRSELERVDKECVRPLQVRAFRCCAGCAEDRSSSAEVVGQCVQSCMRPVVEADQLAKQEVQTLQDRLSRCAQQCQDQTRDQLPVVGNPMIDQEEKAKKSFEDCLIKCCDTHEHLIPKLVSRIRASTGKC